MLCASQALTMEEPSSSSSSTVLFASGRAIDRHNPMIRDSRRIATSHPPPSTTPHSPVTITTPNPHKKKNRTKLPLKENYTEISKNERSIDTNPIHEKEIDSENVMNGGGGAVEASNNTVRKSWNCTKPGGFISPPGSTRYLLGDDDDKVLFNAVSDLDPNLKLFPEENSEPNGVVVKSLDGKLSPVSVNPDQPQVVVLRVSLHCRGCERKMRKHLSKMEGVTSFTIDFTAKKVTVTGNVTPLGVLSSISKVKNAQLLSPTTISSVNLDGSGMIKNEQKGGDAQVGDKTEEVFVSIGSQI